MNTAVKNILIFIGGLAIGSVGTYFVLQKQLDIRVEEEVASVKEYAKRQIEKKNEELTYEEKNDFVVKATGGELFLNPKNEKFNGIPVPSYKTITDDMQEALVAGITDYSGGEENTDQKWYEDISPAEKLKLPFIIPADEFEYGMLHFDKITIYYYEGDKKFADDEDELIDSPTDLIGDAHHYFGYMPEEPDLVYIRNYKYATDYELCRSLESYTDSLLGGYIEKKNRKDGIEIDPELEAQWEEAQSERRETKRLAKQKTKSVANDAIPDWDDDKKEEDDGWA